MDTDNTKKIEVDATEYDKLKKEVEELKEKNKSNTQEWQRNLHKMKFYKDPTYALDLVKSDKKMVKDLAKEHGYDDVHDFLEAIKQLDSDGEKKTEEKPDDKVQGAVDGYLDGKNIDKDSDFGKDVLKLYSELSEWVKLTEKRAKALIREAYLESKKTSDHSETYKKKMEELKLAGVSGSNAKGGKVEAKKPAIQVNKRWSFREVYGKKDK